MAQPLRSWPRIDLRQSHLPDPKLIGVLIDVALCREQQHPGAGQVLYPVHQLQMINGVHCVHGFLTPAGVTVKLDSILHG